MIINQYEYIYKFFEELVINSDDKYKVFQSPGNRNSPIMAVADLIPELSTEIILDERSSSFSALGFAKSGGTSILTCTSGSAVAHYLPALLEAKMSSSKMLIIAADRPPHLAYKNENQTFLQNKIFQGLDFPQFDLDPYVFAENMVDWQRIASQISFLLDQGPVFVNFRIRKPFQLSKNIYQEIQRKIDNFNSEEHFKLYQGYNEELFKEKLNRSIKTKSRPLIVFGNLDNMSLAEQKANIPHWLDLNSGRQKNSSTFKDIAQIKSYKPDLIIYFGKSTIENSIKNYIEKEFDGELFGICAKWDDIPYSYPAKILINDRPKVIEAESDTFLPVENKQKKLFSGLNEIVFLDRFLDKINPEDIIIIGNSLPVRALDFISHRKEIPNKIITNRGLSGIDGFLSFAHGVNNKKNKKIYLLIGDQTFLHDQEFLKHLDLESIKLIIFNNGGGGIFSAFKKDFPENFWTKNLYNGVLYRELFDRDQLNVKTIEFLEQIDPIMDKGFNILEIITPPHFSEQFFKETSCISLN